MKTKIKSLILKVEFSFAVGVDVFRVQWTYIGTKELQCINYKNWRIAVINNYDGSGMANKFIGDTYTSTLQPNLTNSRDFLEKILQ